mgnify:CR=1 FL=1
MSLRERLQEIQQGATPAAKIGTEPDFHAENDPHGDARPRRGGASEDPPAE